MTSLTPKTSKEIIQKFSKGAYSTKLMGLGQEEGSDPPPQWCASQTDLSYIFPYRLSVTSIHQRDGKNNAYVYMEHLRTLDT